MLEQLLQYDKELFLFFNNLGSETWDSLWLIITHKLTFAPLYAFLLFLLYKNLGLKRVLLLVIIIALMITFTDQITNVFKHSFKRLRPCGTEGVKDQMRFIADYCGRYAAAKKRLRTMFANVRAKAIGAMTISGTMTICT